jgi:hypothetical protein
VSGAFVSLRNHGVEIRTISNVPSSESGGRGCVKWMRLHARISHVGVRRALNVFSTDLNCGRRIDAFIAAINTDAKGVRCLVVVVGVVDVGKYNALVPGTSDAVLVVVVVVVVTCGVVMATGNIMPANAIRLLTGDLSAVDTRGCLVLVIKVVYCSL